MLSRALAIVISTWLPCLAVILPLSPFHKINGLVSGIVAFENAARSAVDTV